MKFSSVAAIASLLSLTAALPLNKPSIKEIKEGNKTFELTGLTTKQNDIKNPTPLVVLDDTLGFPEGTPSNESWATVNPWPVGQLEVVTKGKPSGKYGYLEKSDKDNLYDFKFGKPSSDSKSKGFFAAEGHPAGLKEGAEQLFYSDDGKGDNADGKWVMESKASDKGGQKVHPIKFFDTKAAKSQDIPDGLEEVWILRPGSN
ncbi:hypothetical protein KEM55_000039 [Ascosphaera atra]|nr:hypothetical protein KEM55_000039 [Ascosphaera atra]